MEAAELAPEISEAEFRSIAREVLPAVAQAVGLGAPDATSGIDEPPAEMHRRFDVELYRRGWAGLHWPREYGGAGRTLVEHSIFLEEAAPYGMSVPFNRVGIGIVSPAIMMYGTEEQKTRFLRSTLSTDTMWCQGFSEPDAGSDLAALKTRAVRDGDVWRITGQKVWTTLVHLADYCFLLARTDDSGPRHRGITAFLIPMDQPGVTVRSIRQITGDTEFGEIFFDDAIASTDSVLGDIDGGWGLAMSALGYERSVHLLQRQLHLDRVLAVMAAMLAGSGVDTSVVDELIDMQIDSAAMRYSVRSQLRELDQGLPPSIDANATKVLWSETSQRLNRLAVEIAMAYPGVLELDRWLEEYYKSLATSIYAGTNQVQRNIIAERGLGLPR